MAAESSIGARLSLIGKTQFLAGIKEAKAAVVASNAEMAASSEAATAKQVEGYATMAEAQAAYRAETAANNAANLASYTAFGRKAAFALGAAAVVIGYESLKIHSQFQSAMLQTVNLAGVSQSRLAALTAGIKGMSAAVNQGLTPLANALYRVASTPAGLKATNNELLAMVKYSAMLTTIGGPGTDLEQTARIMGGALTTGVKGATSPKQIATLAAATVGSGDIRMSDVVDFMGSGALTSAKLTGIPLNQMMAFLAMGGSNLMSGQVSGHAIAHGLQLMFAPTPTAQKALGVLGLGATTLADTGRKHGLGAAVHQLGGALGAPLAAGSGAQLAKFGFTSSDIAQAQTVGLGKMGDHGKSLENLILTRMFGGAKMGIPLDMLVSQSGNYDTILKHINKQADNPNTLNLAMGRQMDTLSGKTGAFTKSLANLADTIGKTLTPVAKEFLGIGTSVADMLGKNKYVAGALGVTITGILGPAVVLYGIRKFTLMGGAIRDVVKGYVGAIQMIRQFMGVLLDEGASLVGNDAALATNTRAEVANTAASRGLSAKVLGAAKGAASIGAVSAGAGLAAVAALGAVSLYSDKHNAAAENRYGMFGSGINTNALRALTKSKLPDLSHLGDISNFGSAQWNASLATINANPGAYGLQVHAHLYVDGKELTTSVQKTVKAQAARN